MAAFNLTPRELEILVAYVKESKGNVDWEKVAESSNCKTSKYARDKFALIRNKLLSAAPTGTGGTEGDEGDAAEANGNATTPASKKKATASSAKRKKDGDDDETPSKRGKKTSTTTNKKKGKKTESGDGSDAEVKEEPNEAGGLMDDLEDMEEFA